MTGIVILAAGHGSRLHSLIPKPLVTMLGTPMIGHIITKVPSNLPLYIIVNPQHKNTFESLFPHATILCQQSPQGTGQALVENIDVLSQHQHLIILNADTPLIPSTIFHTLSADPRENILVGFESLKDEAYGQLNLSQQKVIGIVEAKDRAYDQKHYSHFYYSGVMKLSRAYLNTLQSLPPSSVTQEYYLTSLASPNNPFDLFIQPKELFDGINTPSELLELTQRLRHIQTQAHLANGISLDNPDSILISPDSSLGQHTHIGANVSIKNSHIGRHCSIGQGVVLTNARIADGVTILPYSVITDSDIAKGASIGPFAHIQGHSQVGEQAIIGNFVEIKRSTICSGVKAKHLSYLGDAYIDQFANIGAGVITCNYVPWEQKKQLTYVGQNAFIGSNCQLIAPSVIGCFSVSAAGSIITKDIPPFALAISRPDITIKPNWTKTKRLKWGKNLALFAAD